MVAARTRHHAAGLVRAALLAAVLAVLAGLLGMHVFSASHAAHASAAGAPSGEVALAAASGPSASGHAEAGHSGSGHSTAGHPASTHPGTAPRHKTPAPPSCGGAGDCGGQSSTHVSCTPAPSGASLHAPAPGTTLLAVQPRTAPSAEPASACSHHPATPTPNELSISRT